MKEPRPELESSARRLALALALQLAGCSSEPPAVAVPPEEQFQTDVRALHDAHRFRAALAAAEQRLASAPDDAAALDWKTRLLRELGEERLALEVVQARRAKAPQDAALAYEAGELFAHVGADDKALVAFDEAHALAPDDWRPAVGAAALLLSKKSPDVAGAQARLAPFLEGPHASAEALFHHGLAFEVAKDDAGARAAFERALVLDPLHVPSLRDLALLAEKSGDEKGALDLWQRVKRSTSPLDAKFAKEVEAKIEALTAKLVKAADAAAASKADTK
jgi:tetratricopeptide (TPR) repeat protein